LSLEFGLAAGESLRGRGLRRIDGRGRRSRLDYDGGYV